MKTDDAVSNIALMTTGLTSSHAAANLITASSLALGLSFQNAIANQQQTYMVHQSAGVQGRNSMFATTLNTIDAMDDE